MELTKKQQFWKDHIDAVEVFDGSAAEYARLHGLEAKKLYVYKTAIQRKLCGGDSTTSDFVQVTTTSTAAMNTGVSVWLPNGVRLSLSALSEPGLLERLAKL